MPTLYEEFQLEHIQELESLGFNRESLELLLRESPHRKGDEEEDTFYKRVESRLNMILRTAKASEHALNQREWNALVYLAIDTEVSD